jgi:hypothetical protein
MLNSVQLGEHSAEALVKFASFYTNGQQLVAITTNNKNSTKFKTFSFDLPSSKFISSYPRFAAVLCLLSTFLLPC